MLERMPFSTNTSYRYVATLILLMGRDYQGLIDFNNRLGREEHLDSNLNKMTALVDVGRAAHYLGNIEKAEEYTQEAIGFGEAYQSSNPNNMAWVLNALTQAYAISGQLELALAASRNARELKPESQDSLEGPELSNTYAMILGMAGQRDEALAEIERLLNTPAGLNRWILNLSPDWDFFRDDERFNELIRPLNLEEAGE
jgi:tetratricopeptide (TPR) repeat protein